MFSLIPPLIFYAITIYLDRPWHQELRKVIQELTRAVCSGGFSEWRYSNALGQAAEMPSSWGNIRALGG